MGNIYADEALWRARIHPLTPAAALEDDEVKALYRASGRRCAPGIRRQGSTLRDYRLPDGEEGGAQHEFKVYGRGGEPCDRCGDADRQDPRCRQRDVVLPGLPAPAPRRR